ncbi:4Fe-4S binding protein [Sedimentibacter sp. zth1]|uniref:[Fe-Fe] hydrogenase large subunit C-terminal domain-containing protein n=1 Tax=Sedimentibacter sp. zth1 TaxID=2816908 RepID=UPI001A928111|nr:[Fe-Fe] hydrogenase large subunit C-terminal domain-containing protein [Sedimentibacter sp. zth1]QSX06199.1 4Fe-4S binding protein [Sedimentibacter sp. zth1]
MDFSILLDSDKCRGCTNCMKKCPTQAIRIKNEKAVIDKNKCIYCGECIKACPYNAYSPYEVNKNDFVETKFSIAIPSTALYGQFPKGTEICNIQNSILKLGFDYVYDESYAAELTSKAIARKISESEGVKPIISTNCPAIVRLIKIRYLSLLDNLITVESPMEIAARLAKHNAHENFDVCSEDIKIYYISPCPAEMLSITNPIGTKKSSIDSVIPLNSIYGDIYREVCKNTKLCNSTPSIKGIKWAIAGGQSETINVSSYISVYGIENIIDILEEIENGKLHDIDYVELSVCTEGCVGGIFNVENPFIAKRNIDYIIKNTKETFNAGISDEVFNDLYEKNFFDIEIIKEDTNKRKLTLAEAVERMERIEQITALLPGLDCGSCGSPTCRAYAEDICDGHADLYGCILLKANKKRLNSEEL